MDVLVWWADRRGQTKATTKNAGFQIRLHSLAHSCFQAILLPLQTRRDELKVSFFIYFSKIFSFTVKKIVFLENKTSMPPLEMGVRNIKTFKPGE